MNIKKAIYAGTFDPFTFGHLDILTRATKIFDQITLVLAENDRKKPFLAVEKRKTAIEKVLSDFPSISVIITSELIVNTAKKIGASTLIRGCRNALDLESESQLCTMNQQLAPEIDTVLFIPRPTHQHISSTLVREILVRKGNIAPFVPQIIADAYQNS